MALLIGSQRVNLALQCLSLRRLTIAYGAHTPLAYLFMGMIASVLAHGAFESAPIMGSSVNVMTLCFAVGMIDRLPVLMAQEEAAWEHWLAEGGDELEAEPELEPDYHEV